MWTVGPSIRAHRGHSVGARQGSGVAPTSLGAVESALRSWCCCQAALDVRWKAEGIDLRCFMAPNAVLGAYRDP